MLQFDSVARASKVGYEAVREPLAEWAAAGFPPDTMIGADREPVGDSNKDQPIDRDILNRSSPSSIPTRTS